MTISLDKYDVVTWMTENPHDIQQISGSSVRNTAIIYIVFDANKPDSLEQVENYYKFINNYKLNEKIIIKVIALRVPANTTSEIKRTLTDVKSWAEAYNLEFLEFDNYNYAN